MVIVMSKEEVFMVNPNHYKLICDLQGENEEKDKEIERLQNIIKEAREYVNNIKFETKREEKIQDDILDILDKENE